GPVDGDARLGAVGMVQPRHPVGTQIETEVGVQVTEVDGIDRIDVDMSLQNAQPPVAQLEQESEAVCLHEVAGCGAVRPGKAPGGSDNRESHVVAFSVGRAASVAPLRVRMAAAGSADVP